MAIRIYLAGLLLASAALASAQNVLPPDYAQRLAELERYHQADPTDMDTADALAGSYSMGAQYQKAIVVVQEMHETTAGLRPPRGGPAGGCSPRAQAWRPERPSKPQARLRLQALQL